MTRSKHRIFLVFFSLSSRDLSIALVRSVHAMYENCMRFYSCSIFTWMISIKFSSKWNEQFHSPKRFKNDPVIEILARIQFGHLPVIRIDGKHEASMYLLKLGHSSAKLYKQKPHFINNERLLLIFRIIQLIEFVE